MDYFYSRSARLVLDRDTFKNGKITGRFKGNEHKIPTIIETVLQFASGGKWRDAIVFGIQFSMMKGKWEILIHHHDVEDVAEGMELPEYSLHITNTELKEIIEALEI